MDQKNGLPGVAVSKQCLSCCTDLLAQGEHPPGGLQRVVYQGVGLELHGLHLLVALRQPRRRHPRSSGTPVSETASRSGEEEVEVAR